MSTICQPINSFFLGKDEAFAVEKQYKCKFETMGLLTFDELFENMTYEYVDFLNGKKNLSEEDLVFLNYYLKGDY